MLLAQKNNPERGDWVTEFSELIKDIEINLEFEDIGNMTRSGVRNLTEKKTEKAAFLDLKQKQQKGRRPKRCISNQKQNKYSTCK